jgi:hypothetical protein
MEESKLEKLKKEYSKLEEKYSLPSFDELNRDFNIEKAAEIETDYLIREVRKFIADKISNYMRFIESVLNPVNVPMFIFSLVKTIKIEERKKLADLYKKLAKTEVDLISVDVSFSEDREAEFIKKTYTEWKKVSRTVFEIMESIKNNWGNKIETNDKGYFG